MAKSIRSKWKRKMRAVKRERYGKKELDRLKKTLGLTEEDASTSTSTDQMVDVSDIVTVTNKEEIVKKKRKNEQGNAETEDKMEVDVSGRKFSSKTMTDQNGTYPVWMHPRKIRQYKRAKKLQEKKSKKKNNKRKK